MSDVKEAANKLYTHAISKKLNFPKIWEETKCIQTCAATLVPKYFNVIIYPDIKFLVHYFTKFNFF